MNTQELKKYINRVLGNKIRCLLPSYWWKRLFGMVVDKVDEVEQSALEVAEASKMPIVASEKELNKLDLPKGSIAAVGISERSFSECYLPEITENFNTSSLTKIEEIVVKGGSAPTRDMGLFILVDVDITENIIIDAGIDADNTYAITATYRTVDGNLIDSFILELNGKPYSAGLGYFNALLKEKSFYYGGYDGSPLPADVLAFVDAHLAWKSEGSDLYIKGASWERLAKESDLEGIEGGSVDAQPVLFYAPLSENGSLDDTLKAKNVEAYNKVIINGSEIDEKVFDIKISCGGLMYFDVLSYCPLASNNTIRLIFDNATSDIASLVVSSDGNVVFETEEAVDSELSTSSEKSVQNKVITAALNNKADKTYVDNAVANVTVDTSGLATKEELNNAIATSITNILNTEV